MATNHDEQIRVPHVLKNMGHPAFAPDGDLLAVDGGDISRFAVPAAGPTEQTPFFAADPADPFDINIVSFITFKPLP